MISLLSDQIGIFSSYNYPFQDINYFKLQILKIYQAMFYCYYKHTLA